MKDMNRVFLYTILVEGQVSWQLLHSQRDFTVKKLSSGNTKIEIIAQDNAAFYGVINILRDSGISIIKIDRKQIFTGTKKDRNYKRNLDN
ncbi:MAG: hypothetical protein JW822_05205 [Spirochaetales bacterium]|nr:hypothetical protein [Spirochaetales bacterium]